MKVFDLEAIPNLKRKFSDKLIYVSNILVDDKK